MTPFHQFSIVFAALFVITNPLGNLGVFISITEGDSEAFRKRQALKAAVYSFCLLFTFFVGGKFILEFFGITINGIQICGGLIIAKFGFSLLAGTKHHNTTGSEAQEARDKEDVSFCPLAMPMVAGPGGLAVVISAANKTTLALMDYVSITAAIAASCLIVWLCFREAKMGSQTSGRNGHDRNHEDHGLHLDLYCNSNAHHRHRRRTHRLGHHYTLKIT